VGEFVKILYVAADAARFVQMFEGSGTIVTVQRVLSVVQMQVCQRVLHPVYVCGGMRRRSLGRVCAVHGQHRVAITHLHSK
jgi:hypothetical protein